jgi:2-haloacid dehalogenase
MPVFVFDAYGTLFDVHAAIARHRAEAGPDADRMSEIWRSKQLEYSWTLTLAGRYRDFWTLTQRALDAYPDARAILRTLKGKGHKTGILSNGSPDMLKGAVDGADVGDDLDVVLSVDVLKMFKPRPEVYALVTDHFKCQPGDVTFVSSNRWDVMAGTSVGFRTCWINRAGMPDEYPDFPPAQTLGNLGELANVA